MDWDALPLRYEEAQQASRQSLACDLLVGCVDSRAARRTLDALAFDGHAVRSYWLDLGNTESTAQVVLGQPCALRTARASAPRLPCVTELFAELLNATPQDHQPSCSVRMSLASQGLFVNDLAVLFAAQLLYELFSTGRLPAHGVVVNLATKRSGPIDVDPRTWTRFGFVDAMRNGTNAGPAPQRDHVAA